MVGITRTTHVPIPHIMYMYNNIYIEENEKYEDIKMIISTLNKSIEKDINKYIYNGQRHHNLAYEYDTNNFDKNISSNCSPQLYEILTSKACMNSPFL